MISHRGFAFRRSNPNLVSPPAIDAEVLLDREEDVAALLGLALHDMLPQRATHAREEDLGTPLPFAPQKVLGFHLRARYFVISSY